MAQITYIEHDDTQHVIDVPDGLSVMEGAVDNDVEGIEADCGGCCSCATCHVYVDEAWLGRLPPRDEMESEMLELTAAERRANSRLSCQLTVGPELDGLIVHLPPFQT